MKTPSDNFQLHNFLRDTLKNLDVQYQQPDWNDMESLLGPAHTPIAVNISKKTILISASAAMVVIIGIIISQTIHFGSSSSEKTSPENINSSQNLLQAVDSQKTPVANVAIPEVDSAKVDSSALIENENVTGITSISSADSTSARKIIDNQKNNSKNVSQPVEKKKKKNGSENNSAVDTASVKIIPQVQVPVVDTTTNHSHQVIPSPAAPDSSKKNKKERKQRLKFLFGNKKDSLK